ncbi:MAG: ferritin-like domain-containing protein [Nevskiales bacterium]|nr:ferritin-like domain-containing protein [Nevskiales bacterium]
MTMMEKMIEGMPLGFRRQLLNSRDAFDIARRVRNPKVLTSMAGSVGRGLILKSNKQGEPVDVPAAHSAHFDFEYRSDYPEMYELYRRALENQWNGDTSLDWSIDVDPENPNTAVLPMELVPLEGLAENGIKLNRKEQIDFTYSFASWLLSQFLHGEQGALYASAQVTESVHWIDGKFYGSTQVIDEGRHVEVFFRYIETKLGGKLYQCNDNLYVILDALLRDSRWDMKFLGMQIMVEGLALGAFSQMYSATREPLLANMLKYVIQDEARHVHYGVLALKRHFAEISEKERQEREDWAFEVALLMKNRFLAHEMYEEWFEHRMSRRKWDHVIHNSAFMSNFSKLMFKRLIPNLEYIGILSPRIQKHYAAAGLMEFAGGKNASQLSGDDLINDLAA